MTDLSLASPDPVLRLAAAPTASTLATDPPPRQRHAPLWTDIFNAARARAV